MPKIRKPPPAGILDHLLERFRDGRIAAADFVGLKRWLESDVEVPSGKWYKRFANFTLAGEGELPKTFLAPDMQPYGVEVIPQRYRLASPQGSWSVKLVPVACLIPRARSSAWIERLPPEQKVRGSNPLGRTNHPPTHAELDPTNTF